MEIRHKAIARKPFLLALILISLASFAHCEEASECGDLGTANALYTMSGPLSNDSTCFNITAENVTLDCAGFPITGQNLTGSYGIRSSVNNTKV